MKVVSSVYSRKHGALQRHIHVRHLGAALMCMGVLSSSTYDFLLCRFCSSLVVSYSDIFPNQQISVVTYQPEGAKHGLHGGNPVCVRTDERGFFVSCQSQGLSRM